MHSRRVLHTQSNRSNNQRRWYLSNCGLIFQAAWLKVGKSQRLYNWWGTSYARKKVWF